MVKWGTEMKIVKITHINIQAATEKNEAVFPLAFPRFEGPALRGFKWI